MKKFLLQMLSEHSTVSSMRVMSFISLLAAILIAVMGIYLNRDVISLVSLFTLSAFGGKVAQKAVE